LAFLRILATAEYMRFPFILLTILLLSRLQYHDSHITIPLSWFACHDPIGMTVLLLSLAHCRHGSLVTISLSSRFPCHDPNIMIPISRSHCRSSPVVIILLTSRFPCCHGPLLSRSHSHNGSLVTIQLSARFSCCHGSTIIMVPLSRISCCRGSHFVTVPLSSSCHCFVTTPKSNNFIHNSMIAELRNEWRYSRKSVF
jgi:hypothetical protein